MEQLDGKVAVVTGAGSGIGRALVDRFVDEGMRVVGADVEGDALAETAGERDAVHSFICDVSNADEVAALADYTYAMLGSCDVLCNNAGVFTGGLMWQRPASDFAWMLGVNLWGILNGIHAFVPRMIEARSPAHIVNTVSMAGVCTNAYSGPYTVSKFAALAATECLAHDLAAVGAPIKVSAVVPAAVDTKIAAAGRNRPTALAADFTDDAAFVEQALTDLTTSAGAPPAEVAGIIVDAIHTEQFLVPTKPSFETQMRNRHEAMLEKRLPPMPDFD